MPVAVEQELRLRDFRHLPDQSGALLHTRQELHRTLHRHLGQRPVGASWVRSTSAAPPAMARCVCSGVVTSSLNHPQRPESSFRYCRSME